MDKGLVFFFTKFSYTFYIILVQCRIMVSIDRPLERPASADNNKSDQSLKFIVFILTVETFWTDKIRDFFTFPREFENVPFHFS